MDKSTRNFFLFQAGMNRDFETIYFGRDIAERQQNGNQRSEEEIEKKKNISNHALLKEEKTDLAKHFTNSEPRNLLIDFFIVHKIRRRAYLRLSNCVICFVR